ncbi:MAG: hypothetical protein O3A47_06840, partial [Chloroflexi bacterium]|nr:hypothetical protein [Chloroflexota bacterium]
AIESGVDAGFANPYQGVDRQRWRFSKPGADYGSNVYVEAVSTDGTIRHVMIPDGSKRTP